MKFALIFIAGLSALLAVAGLSYQALASARDRRRFPPPGKLVDVGGYSLHLYCTGSGAPTVILSARYFAFQYWSGVHPRIAEFTTVCSYDAAWHGWSDGGRAPLTSTQEAEDLHRLLQQAAVAPPYILVADSQSQFDARVYVGQHQQEVGGVVLADAVQDDFVAKIAEIGGEEWERMVDVGASILRLQMWLAPLGVPRLLGWCADTSPPARIAALNTALACRTTSFRGIWFDASSFDENLREARAAGTFRDLPLVVISRDPKRVDTDHGAWAEKFNPIWVESQKDLLKLSSHSSQVIAYGCGHNIPLDCPDVIAAAVRKVVATSNAGGQLQ